MKPLVSPPEWVAGRTWYHLYPLGALGCAPSNPDPSGTGPTTDHLARLLPWLDHLVELGVGGVVLGPVFASLTHGYDTVDPLRIDARLGDQAALADLVAACHERELKILLDGVFNHVSREFPPFVDVRANGPASRYRDWFVIDFDGDGPDGFAYRDFEGHHELVALDHRHPEVLEWAVEVATHWSEAGIDGWRLDAAYAVPTEFWSAFSGRVLKRYPHQLLVGEVMHGDYAGVVRSTGLHSVTQYELHKAIWSSLNDANFYELAWALRRHAGFCETFVPLTFVGNHDVTRILSVLRDASHLGHALAVLFSVPGMPCVYYGDELGLRGIKEPRPGGDDEIRPPLPPRPDRDGPDPLGLHRDLVGFRRQRPWLTTADVEVVDIDNHHVRYQVTAPDGAVLVILNVGTTSVPLSAPDERWRAVVGAHVDDGSVAPGGWAILEAT
jgi:cyclomaltodextrinase